MIKKLASFFFIVFLWIVIKLGANLSMIDWINISFLIGTVLLLLSAFAFIVKSGFLSLFFHGFQTMSSFIVPHSRAMERTNKMLEQDEKLQAFKKNISSYIVKITLLIGSSSITVSIIGLIIYLF